MSALVDWGAIEHPSIEINRSTGSAFTPGTTWTVPNGTTSEQYNTGPDFSVGAGAWEIDDAVGGEVLVRAEVYFVTATDEDSVQWGFSIDDATPTEVLCEVKPSLGTYIRATLLAKLSLTAGSDVRLKCKNPTSTTCQVQVVRGQMTLERVRKPLAPFFNNLHTWLRSGYGYTLNNPTLTAPTDFTNVAWDNGGTVTVTPDATTGPTRGTFADLLTVVSPGTGAWVRQSAGNQDTTVAVTIKVVAKAGTTEWLNVQASGLSDTRVWFDLVNGVVGTINATVLEANIRAVGNGFYECSVKLPSGVADHNYPLIRVADNDFDINGTLGDTLYLYSVTVENGNVSAWVDQISSFSFTQATAANQPVTATREELNRHQALTFNGSTTRLACTNATAHSFIHHQAGSSMYVVYRPETSAETLGHVLHNRPTFAAGGSIIHSHSLMRAQFVVEDTSGNSASITTTGGTVPDSTVFVASMRSALSASPDVQATIAGVSTTGDISGWVDGGNSDGALALGARSASVQFFTGQIAEAIVYDRRLSDAEDAEVLAYLKNKFECELSVPNNVLYIRADRGITLNGSDVAAWADQGPQGNNASQGTAANQPAFNLSDSDFGGQSSVQFDGVDEFMAANGVATFIDGDDQPFSIVHSSVNNWAAQGIFWSLGNSANNGPFCYGDARSTPRLSFSKNDGTNSAFVQAETPTVDSNAHIISWGHTGTTATIRQDDNAIGCEGETTNVNTLGTMDRFSIATFGRISEQTWMNCKFNSFAVYSQALSSYQRQLLVGVQTRRIS